MQTILFLCTGNYYRSRFAEYYFNHLASEKKLPWRAESRGLNPYSDNPGPISVHTARALQLLDIELGELRFPLLVTEEDFQRAHHVVAVKEAEHRLLMTELFPKRVESIEYWHVHDLDCSGPEDTIGHLKREVEALLERFKADAGLQETSQG